MTAAQCAAIVVIAPAWADHPLVVTRYAIAAVPGLLVLTCLGLCAVAQFLARTLAAPAAAPLACAVLVGAVVASGPLPAKYAAGRVSTNDLLDHVRPASTPASARLPPFYRALAAAPGDGVVAEWPWLPQWQAYQDVHGKRILCVVAEAFADPGVHQRSAIPAALVLAGGGDFDWLVVHKNPLYEWPFVTGVPLPVLDAPSLAAIEAGAAASLHALGAVATLRLVEEDERIAVFAKAPRR
jgi:hypothetical protein